MFWREQVAEQLVPTSKELKARCCLVNEELANINLLKLLHLPTAGQQIHLHEAKQDALSDGKFQSS